MMLSLAAAIAMRVAVAQDLNAPITYMTPAVSANRAIEGIASLIGERAEVQGPLLRNTLVVQVANVPAKTVFDKIASVLRASWKEEGGKIVFFRSEETTDKLRKESQARIAASYAEALRIAVPEMLPSGPIGNDVQTVLERLKNVRRNSEADIEKAFQGLEALNTFDEGPALVGRAALLVDPQDVGASFVDSPLVASSDPRAGQIGLRVDDDIQQLIAEQNASTTLWKATTSVDPQHRSADENREMMDSSSVRLIVGLTHQFSWILSASLVDSSGRPIAHDVEYLVTKMAHVEPLTEEQKRIGGQIELSALTKEIHGIRAAMGLPNRKPIEASQELREALLDPESHDPNSFLASDVVLGLAKARDANVVACLDDETALGASGDAGVMLQTLMDEKHVYKEGGSWVTIAPLEALDAESRYIPRAAIARYLHAISDDPFLNVDDTATLVASTRFSPALSLVESLRSVLKPASRLRGWAVAEPYIVWGALTDEQRTALRAGKTLPVPQGHLREVISNSVLHATESPIPIKDLIPTNNDLVFEKGKEILGEEVAADVLESGAELRLTSSSSYLLVVKRSGVKDWTVSVPQLAQMAAFSPVDMYKNWSYSFETQKQYVLHVLIGGGCEDLLTMVEDQDDWNAPIPYGALPEDLRASIEEAVKKTPRRMNSALIPTMPKMPGKNPPPSAR